MTESIPILVLAWNKHEMTSQCVESIKAITNHPHHIILIDNGSDEPYPKSDDYDLLRLETNLFYTEGMNAGLSYVSQHYPNAPGVVLLNNDTRVREGWLQNLCQGLDEDVGLVGNKQIRMDAPSMVVHGGTADLLTGMHQAGPDEARYNRETDEVWLTFACVYITRHCLNAVGILDRRMRHFYSDTDFCLRVWMAGFRVVYRGQSVIEHKHHASYGEVPVNLAADRRTFENKWMGFDLNSKIFHKIFIDAEAKTMLNLRAEMLQTPQDST